MKPTNLLTLIFLILPIIAVSQKFQPAPLNPEFEEYLLNLKEGNKEYIESYSRFGKVPSPVMPNFSTILKNINLMDELPEHFDLRDVDGMNYISEVKNQGPYGTCWAFGATGAIESYWLMLGKEETLLSERHIVTCHGGEWHPVSGGNFTLAMAYATRRDGMKLDDDHPYSGFNQNSTCHQNISSYAFVDQARLLPVEQTDIIKQHLMQYGAMYTSMHWDGSYYDESNFTYCRDGSATGGHAVTLLGWDDNKETQCGTGAWIVKNSWGSSWGNEGYFYIAYQDNYFPNTAGYFPDYNPNPAYPYLTDNERLSYYDEMGWIRSIGKGDNTGFVATQLFAGQNKRINKVGTYVTSTNTTLEITIYNDAEIDQNGELVSLNNMVAHKSNIECDFPGYYSVEMPAVVDDFYFVKIKYHTPGYNFPIPVEAYIDGYVHPYINQGVAWLKSENDDWEKIGSNTQYEYNPSIKVYHQTSNLGPVAAFTSNPRIFTEVDTEIVFENKSYGINIISSHWIFGDDANPSQVITNDFEPVNVTFSDTGYKEISLIVEDAQGRTDTLTVGQYIFITSTDIAEHSKKGKIQIYPNPASSNINIEFNNNNYSILRLYNISGQMIFEKSVENKDKVHINISNIPSGVYFVKAISDDKSVTEKLIIN